MTERSTVAQASLKRYGLKVVASKPFKLSADPRERDLANPLLLTNPSTAGSYDVVWVVDSDGEFARTLPYRTALPRPVVGDAGLAALAWHPQFERFGAPQVSRRFAKPNFHPSKPSSSRSHSRRRSRRPPTDSCRPSAFAAATPSLRCSSAWAPPMRSSCSSSPATASPAACCSCPPVAR